MTKYDTNSYKLYTDRKEVEAKLNKGIRALELAVKYKGIIDKCHQCSTLLVNSET
jgi:hypothetical protein